MRASIFVGFLLFFIIACIGPTEVQNPQAWDEVKVENQRESLVASAEHLAKNRRYRVENRKFSHDCSGFIGAVLYQNGIDVFRGTTELQMRGYGVQLLYEFTQK